MIAVINPEEGMRYADRGYEHLICMHAIPLMDSNYKKVQLSIVVQGDTTYLATSKPAYSDILDAPLIPVECKTKSRTN